MCLSRFFGQPGSKLDLLSFVHMFCWLANSIMPLTFHARPYYNIVFIIRETEKVFNDRMRHQASTDVEHPRCDRLRNQTTKESRCRTHPKKDTNRSRSPNPVLPFWAGGIREAITIFCVCYTKSQNVMPTFRHFIFAGDVRISTNSHTLLYIILLCYTI